MKRVGLYFGSFNPIHVGHLALANYLCEWGYVDELWFVISPQNPFKRQAGLMDDALRLRLVQAAIDGYPKFKACDVEYGMPRPSYTIHTLEKLRSLYPDHDFVLIMGSDNWPNFGHWYQADRLMAYPIIIYPRRGYEVDGAALPPNVTLASTPMLDISSTFIRQSLAEGKDIRYFLHPKVYELLVARGCHADDF